MKKAIAIIILGLLWCNVNETVLAGDCNTTISEARETALTCADNDTLTVDSGWSIIVADHDSVDLQTNSASDVTINNAGTIKAGSAGSTKNDAIEGTDSTNLIVNNSGTIQATNMRGIYIKDSTNMTITNESTGTIKADVRAAIYGNGSTDFTMHNYGTIDSNNRTIEGTSATNLTINNYDGGIIDSTNGSSIKYPGTTNTTINNYSGAIIQSPGAVYSVYLNNGSTVTIYNEGEISAANNNYAIACQACANVGITNSGTVTAGGTISIDLKSVTGTNTVTNTSSGTISAVGTKAIRANISDGLTITNSGTISSDAAVAIDIENSTNATLNNSGTISATTKTVDVGNDLTGGAVSNGSGLVIDNSGTIEASASNGIAVQIGDGTGVFNNVTLTNSGTISALDDSINVYADTTGTKIIVDGEPTFIGEIDMNSTATAMTLSCTLKKDIEIEIHNKTNMTITNNLCGNDTYEIVDSSKNADADNSETNGYLVIDEGLEVVSYNAKYRSENVSTKLKGLFNAANYINAAGPEAKFFRVFYSNVKRENMYKGSMAGVVGQLSPINWGNVTSNIFLGYSNHDGDFDNGEFLGGGNYALGLKNVFTKNGLKVSFSPMIGLNDLDVTDYDSDSGAKVKTNLLSEFLAVNGKIDKEIKTSEEGSLNISVQSTLGMQRFSDYISKFSDGDLSVDESIEQILSGGFEVKYNEELGKGFIIRPYVGVSFNHNLNNNIAILADDDNTSTSPAYSVTSGYYAGLTLNKEAKDINFDLDLMYGNEDGLINQIVAVAFTKSFGKAKKETIKLEPVSDLPKIDESLTTQDYNKTFKEIEMLRDLNKKIKVENAKLKAQNEKLKLLAQKTLEENEVSKKLIVELLKENEKVKLENQIFKNRILENENKELIEQLEGSNAGNKPSGIFLLMFGTIFAIGVLGSAKIITLSFASIYNRIMYRPVRA